jgi:hypothetical protein
MRGHAGVLPRVPLGGTLAAAVLAAALAGAVDLAAQQPPPAPGSARSVAPFDPTGVWVSVVTEDWKWRMPTPAKGDTLGIPLNEAGRSTAGSWDYVKDKAAGAECRAYGAGGIMRMLTRLRIGWVDGQTLKIESDAGRQTKLLHFDRSRPPSGPRTLQGHSIAEWVDVFRSRGGGAPPPYGTGAMRVVTTHLNGGYLRKNGVPYSQDATVTEYVDLVGGPDGTQWMIVKTTVDDPVYLTAPYLTSAHFMREPDESKWQPGTCAIDPPLVPTKPDVR